MKYCLIQGFLAGGGGAPDIKEHRMSSQGTIFIRKPPAPLVGKRNPKLRRLDSHPEGQALRCSVADQGLAPKDHVNGRRVSRFQSPWALAWGRDKEEHDLLQPGERQV